MIVENQGTDNIVLYAVDAGTGKLTPTGQTLALGGPVCAVFVGGK